MVARRTTKLNPTQLARRAEIAQGRRDRTRDKLVDAAYRLFAFHGFDAPTVADIVQEAKVSQGSFYTHFASREQLFADIAAEISAKIHGSILQHIGGISDPALRISLSLRIFLQLVAEDAARGWIMLRILPEMGPIFREIEDAHRRFITDGVATGRFSVVSIDSATALGVGHLLMAIRRLLLHPADRAQVILEASEMQLRALGMDADESRRVTREDAAALDPARRDVPA